MALATGTAPRRATTIGGPEIDFGSQTPGILVLEEAKWNSGVGHSQGVNRDRSQIDLRQAFCESLGWRVYPRVERFLVPGVGRDGSILEPADLECEGTTVHLRGITWDEVVALPSHPLRDEVRRYLSWKEAHGG